MEINVREDSGITIVQLSGELTWTTTPEAQLRILASAQPSGRIVLDMSGVSFMASAGLRLLLGLFRTVNANGGKLLLVGLSEDIRSTMEVTGFLDFFTHCDTLDAGLAQMAS